MTRLLERFALKTPGRYLGTAVQSLLLMTCGPGANSAVTAPLAAESRHENVKQRSAPRLIIWLTVDQLRGETWNRYQSRLSRGGFARFFEQGFVYSQAHYGHAITETAPGHATLFSGAAPREHGIIGNSWLLPSGRETSSVEDADSQLVGPGIGTETQGKGASPHRLLVPTVGDAFRRALGGRSKVFAVSAKDRGAILPAGQSGTAFWLGPQGFVSSSVYGDAPPWLFEHHQEKPPRSYLEQPWRLLDEPAEYSTAPAGSPFAERRLGVGFPHRFSPELAAVKALTLSPFGDRAVLDLARRVVVEEKLGHDKVVDLLSVSLSSTDIIGHVFGPESLEMEDQLVRLDEELARFFADIEKQVPSGVLYVLSADHGGCESASYLRELGLPGARLSEEALESRARQVLQETYGHSRFLLGVSSPSVSLDHAALKEAGASLSEVRALVAAAVAQVPGVFRVFEKGLPFDNDALSQRVATAIHPERSGDIYVVPAPYTLFLQNESLAATHGSPWSYDTHVPLAFSGAGVTPGTSARSVDLRSLAPTVARLAQVRGPDAASFAPLEELLQAR